jgi:hypothetical protein
VDEDDLVKTGLEIVLRPVTDIAENALGVLGGDWLSEVRARNRAKLKDRTEKILHDRHAEPIDVASPSVITPLLSAAQDESRDELIDIWAALLATALNPKTQSQYRREFTDIAKQLEPLDVLVLTELASLPEDLASAQSRVVRVSNRLKRPVQEVALSVEALFRLGLTESSHTNPRLVVRGIQLMRAISSPNE